MAQRADLRLPLLPLLGPLGCWWRIPWLVIGQLCSPWLAGLGHPGARGVVPDGSCWCDYGADSSNAAGRLGSMSKMLFDQCKLACSAFKAGAGKIWLMLAGYLEC